MVFKVNDCVGFGPLKERLAGERCYLVREKTGVIFGVDRQSEMAEIVCYPGAEIVERSFSLLYGPYTGSRLDQYRHLGFLPRAS